MVLVLSVIREPILCFFMPLLGIKVCNLDEFIFAFKDDNLVFEARIKREILCFGAWVSTI